MKTKSFFTKSRWLVTIILLTTLGITNAWGTETLYETITLVDGGSNSDSGTSFATNTSITTSVLTPKDSVTGFSAAAYVYPAKSGYGWKIGSSSNNGNITLTLAHTIKNVTKIVVSAQRYNTSKATNLNCNSIGNKAISNAASFNNYEFTYTNATDVSSINLTASAGTSGDRRCYVKSISIYYDKPASGYTVDKCINYFSLRQRSFAVSL